MRWRPVAMGADLSKDVDKCSLCGGRVCLRCRKQADLCDAGHCFVCCLRSGMACERWKVKGKEETMSENQETSEPRSVTLEDLFGAPEFAEAVHRAISDRSGKRAAFIAEVGEESLQRDLDELKYGHEHLRKSEIQLREDYAARLEAVYTRLQGLDTTALDYEKWLKQLSKRVASLEAKGPVDDRPAASKRVEDINTGLNDAVKKLEGLETWAQGIEDKHADLEAQAEQDNGAWRRLSDRVRVLEEVAAGDEILVRTPADEDRLRKENHILRKAAQVDAKKITALREDKDRLRKRVRDLEEVNEKLLEENGLLGEKADRLNALSLEESSARMTAEGHLHALRERDRILGVNTRQAEALEKVDRSLSGAINRVDKSAIDRHNEHADRLEALAARVEALEIAAEAAEVGVELDEAANDPILPRPPAWTGGATELRVKLGAGARPDEEGGAG